MHDDYAVRVYRPGDEEEIVKLLELVFDGWPHLDLNCSALEHWRWKYEDNPASKTVITICSCGGKIIGCSHIIPLKLKIGDEIVHCFNGADVAVHPDFRKKGLRNKMMELKFEKAVDLGIKYALLTSGNPILIESYRRRNIQFPRRILNLVRIRDINLQLQKMPVRNPWLMKIGFHTLKLLNTISNAVGGSNQKKKEFHISEVCSFDERIDDFWNEVALQHDFIVERNLDYLNWRYCDPRAGEFVIKIAEEDNRILGYVVLRINRYLDDYPIGYIMELLALPNRSDVVDELIKDALTYFDSENINITNFQAVKGHPYQRMFKRHGFLNSRINFILFYQPLGDSKEIQELGTVSADKIFISWGDCDVLPVKIPSYT